MDSGHSDQAFNYVDRRGGNKTPSTSAWEAIRPSRASADWASDPRTNSLTPDYITRSSEKRSLFSSDVYYLDSWDQASETLQDIEHFCRTHSLLLLRPDAIVARKIGPVLAWLDDYGYQIIACKSVRLTRHMIRDIWYFQWNALIPRRRKLADFLLTSTDSLIILLRSPDTHDIPASVMLSDRKGPSDPALHEPQHLRSRLGRFHPSFTFVHTSDEPADMIRELGIYFDNEIREQIYSLANGNQVAKREVLDHVERLYRRFQTRDLSLSGACDRACRAIESLGSSGELAGELKRACTALLEQPQVSEEAAPLWSLILPKLRAYRDVLDSWDVAVMETYAPPFWREGVKSILPRGGLADWRDRVNR